MMETYLKVEGLAKRYGHVSALKGVDLHVDQGSSLVLLGPNGAGKSTLLGVIAGRIRPTGGRVTFKGETLGKNAEARKLTGYLGHASLLYQGLTARENLMMYAKLYGVKDPIQRCDEMLQFIGLWDRRNDRVGGFSRGMEQRLSIARSLLHDPRLILLDEPFSGLDHQASRDFTSTLTQLRDGRRTILMATHDMNAVQGLGDRIVIMDRGRVLHEGPVPGESQGSVRELYTRTVAGAKN